MNKQEAIAKARKFVTMQRGHGCGWVVFYPRFADDPRGMGEDQSFETYHQAQVRCAVETAKVALHFLGRHSTEAAFEIEAAAYGSQNRKTTVRDLLNAA